MIKLPLHIGAIEVLIALSTTPEHIVLATQVLGYFEALLHLRGSVREDIGVAAGRCAVHVTWVAEHVRRTPQQLNAGSLLFLLEDFDDRVEVGVRLGQGGAFWSHIAIVESVVRCSQLPP